MVIRYAVELGKTIKEIGHLLFQLVFMGDRASRGKLKLQFQGP